MFHVLNRGVARMQRFEKLADYQAGDLAAFLQLLTITHVTRWQKRWRFISLGI